MNKYQEEEKKLQQNDGNAMIIIKIINEEDERSEWKKTRKLTKTKMELKLLTFKIRFLFLVITTGCLMINETTMNVMLVLSKKKFFF